MNKLLKKTESKMKGKKKGFTLIEMIVVIAMIGILAAVLMPKFGGFTDKAKKTQVLSDARRVLSAFESYKIENGVYPDSTAFGTDAFKDLIPATDYKDSDPTSGQGVTTFGGANDALFEYKRKVKGVNFDASCSKTGIITVIKSATQPAEGGAVQPPAGDGK